MRADVRVAFRQRKSRYGDSLPSPPRCDAVIGYDYDNEAVCALVYVSVLGREKVGTVTGFPCPRRLDAVLRKDYKCINRMRVGVRVTLDGVKFTAWADSPFIYPRCKRAVGLG